ncbi:1,4-alpha-glucan branching enzyme [Desulfonispora thiosulfatigenes DSM 11270]|uniref:1,4-alpha-glucan branching enzyme n=1 Tax=Desulfonispora thiosulfatigenes DSM 11270 TaxID=656914 RepID=A0A1W1VLT1_DESTI|nr:1,4-alpha-glucan branching enzyme [Desulfonispora thiosulfatigenes DSM 11270]
MEKKKNGDTYNYRELAMHLVEYVKDMGYTHIELLPIMEHPFDGSWGYQITGYFSVTSRFGTPEDFKYFIDKCHQNDIGVILDWVPAHFCKDGHGLARFDGTNIYEKDENEQWGTLNFNYGTPEVVSFLISNAIFWLNEYHIDGLRVDAVASMLYLDYGNQSKWQPNKYGGRENLEAIDFMKKLNEAVFKYFPNALMFAEESTEWPLVTRPTHIGGLGYNYKWNMGWMNDILKYMEMDPIHRKWHHNLLTFSFMYTFSENFLLPLSHDEVVHGKKSLIERMPGDYWKKFAGLRTLYAYMMSHPGKKLLFMGGEFGQFIEWRFYDELDWFLLDYDMHNKCQIYVRDLNKFYLKEKSLYEQDHNWSGFEWIDANNFNQSIIVLMRMAENNDDFLIVVCNFTPVFYEKYRIGVPVLGEYNEVFNSDKDIYGGSNQLNDGVLIADKEKWHNKPYSLELKVPPLACIFLRNIKKEIEIIDPKNIKEEL